MLTRFIFLTFSLLTFALAQVGAQQILFHPATDTATSSGMALHSEIWRAASPARAVVPQECLAALFGDRNGNGQLDDAPARFDALALSPNGALYVSLASNLPLVGGGTLLDGDVFRLDAAALLNVAYGEAMFAAATGADTVDVDAFAIGPQGEIYFSFEDDEVTSLTALIAQNGGNALLDEQCIFRLLPSQQEATLHMTQANVVSCFNAAFGTNATSVVDTTGIEIDPLDTNALWITCGSSSAALKGRIVSTRNGGTVVNFGAAAFDPSAIGFASNCSLDSLAWGSVDWPVLRLMPAGGSSSGLSSGQVVIEGLGSMETVQLFVTAPMFPGPFVIPSVLPGWTGVHVDPTDPLFALSAMAPQFTLMADSGGSASFAFGFGGMAVGLQAMVQAVEISNLRVTSPAVLTVLP